MSSLLLFNKKNKLWNCRCLFSCIMVIFIFIGIGIGIGINFVLFEGYANLNTAYAAAAAVASLSPPIPPTSSTSTSIWDTTSLYVAPLEPPIRYSDQVGNTEYHDTPAMDSIPFGTAYVQDPTGKLVALLGTSNSMAKPIIYDPSQLIFGTTSYVPDYKDSILLARK